MSSHGHLHLATKADMGERKSSRLLKCWIQVENAEIRLSVCNCQLSISIL